MSRHWAALRRWYWCFRNLIHWMKRTMSEHVPIPPEQGQSVVSFPTDMKVQWKMNLCVKQLELLIDGKIKYGGNKQSCKETSLVWSWVIFKFFSSSWTSVYTDFFMLMTEAKWWLMELHFYSLSLQQWLFVCIRFIGIFPSEQVGFDTSFHILFHYVTKRLTHGPKWSRLTLIFCLLIYQHENTFLLEVLYPLTITTSSHVSFTN